MAKIGEPSTFQDLINLIKTKLGTSAYKNVPSSGNASATEVVMGNDSRLSDARTPVSHTHSKSQITDFPSLGTSSSKDVSASGDASATEVVMGNDSRLSDARTPVSHTHTVSEVTDFPTLGTASSKNVSTSGDASATEVVMGDDSRLSDSRTPVSHTHTVSEVTDFPSTMPPSSHTHTVSEVTDFPSTMPPSSHTHTTADVTDLDLTPYQTKNLVTPITVDGVQKTTVESALEAINDKSVAITVDSALDDTSENPAQNKVITLAINQLSASKLSISDIDSALDDTSENPVQNKVIKLSIDQLSASKLSISDIDSALDDTSTNPVQNKVVKETFDSFYVKAGQKTGTTLGDNATAEGNNTTASGKYSHAEGSGTEATGQSTHAEGGTTKATKNGAHAEGVNTQATGSYSHAEGYGSQATGDRSHAEGYNALASGSTSHAEGEGTTASATYTHAEGYYSKAQHSYSHAEGNNTQTGGMYQHVMGKMNIGKANTLLEIGYGSSTGDSARKNVFEVNTEGQTRIFNDIYSITELTNLAITTKNSISTVEVAVAANGDVTITYNSSTTDTYALSSGHTGAFVYVYNTSNNRFEGDIYVKKGDTQTITLSSAQNIKIRIDSVKVSIFGEDVIDAAGNKLSEKAAATHTHTVSEITDFPSSMPASDVSAWAKASTKPSYTASEVSAIPIVTASASAGFVSGAVGTNSDCNNVVNNAHTYYNSNGPSSSIGHATGTDGALYAQSYNDNWVGEIAQDYRNGNLFVRGKNNGTWTTWLSVPSMIKSTTDISAGTSLTTNCLYVVYEA